MNEKEWNVKRTCYICACITSDFVGTAILWNTSEEAWKDAEERVEAFIENGIGAVKGIAIICDGDRETEYIFRIANDSDSNRIFTKNGKYKETEIRISSILDDILFPDRFEFPIEKQR